VVDGSVVFDDPVGIEARLHEGSVDVAREDEGPVPHPRRQTLQDVVSGVRRGRPVQVEPMAVEAPGQLGVRLEPPRVRHVREREAEVPVRRIRIPEALIAPEVGKPAVDSHSGTGVDDECIGDG